MNKLRTRIIKILTSGDKTIPELCKCTNCTDEFDIISAIGDLESQNKVCLKGFDKFYDNDDGEPRLVFLARYGLL